MKTNDTFAENLENLTETQLWQLSRYMADYAQHEINCGKKVDKHTFFWAFDAILGGALDD